MSKRKLISKREAKANKLCCLTMTIVLSASMITCIDTATAQSAKNVAENISEDNLAVLDERFEAYLEEYNIPGGQIAVMSDGELLAVHSYGFADVENQVVVTADSVFEIGSISKQFTAVAALMLVEEEKLSLDQSIHDFLPLLPSKWSQVSIRQLLNHTSGIPDYEVIAGYEIYGQRVTAQDVIALAQSRPMDFAPGGGWNYTNTGYYLLSLIIESVEGKPLSKVLNERIFKPLKMTKTRMADPDQIIPNRVSGYWQDKSGQLINRKATQPSSTLGAGGLVSTASDMAKWDASLYDTTLLSAKSKKLMWTPVELPSGELKGYGMGWELYSYGPLKRRSHTGQVAGFLSSFDRFPEEKLSFILFLNAYDVSTEIKDSAFHIYIPKLGSLPPIPRD